MRPQAASLAALAAGAVYTALAGFALPTVRTLLMIAVVLLARLLRRAGSGAESLAPLLGNVLRIERELRKAGEHFRMGWKRLAQDLDHVAMDDEELVAVPVAAAL